MSPLSIAQFLEPGKIDFDVVIFDEASQVTPVDSLGALARAKQFIVVGDSRQLPPTRFFQKVGQNEVDDIDDETAPLSNIESILELCISRFNAVARLQTELERAKDALEARKTIDRAKGILMQAKGLTEEQAYAALRKTAMNEKRKIAEVAQAVVTASELLK